MNIANNITISDLIKQANGEWSNILFRLNVTVPENGKHVLVCFERIAA